MRATSRVIARQAKHMVALIDDLLDVSRVTRGLVELRKADVAINSVIAHASIVAMHGGTVRALAALLGLFGHSVAMAVDGDSALSAAKSFPPTCSFSISASPTWMASSLQRACARNRNSRGRN